MDQVRRSIIAATVGLAGAGLGYAWLAVAPANVPGRADVSDLTGVAAPQPTARPLVAAPQAPMSHQGLPSLQQVTVAVRGNLLSVKSDGAPLREILSEITRSVGVTFEFSGDAGEQLSVDLGPRPVKEVISALLDQASYGHAFVDSAGDAGYSRLARVLLVKQGTTANGRGQATTKVVFAKPVDQPSPPDEEAMQQQRAVDALFDACKAQSQACDTS